MDRAIWFKLGTILICLTLVSGICLAQSPALGRKKAVDSFITAWLVRKDIPSALDFLHERALTDGFVLDCGCCGEVSLSKTERRSSKAIQGKLTAFLKEYSSSIQGSALNSILFLRSKENPRQSDDLARKIRKWILNRPERDNYYIVDLKLLESDSDAWAHFGKRYNLRGSFFSVIQYRVLNHDVRYGDDVVVSLLWVRDKGQWKMASIGMASCN